MKVFLSWSGDRSRKVAEALRHWLPDLISFFDPWLSSEDVDKGVRWQAELANQLQQTEIGIVCLTPENRSEPWLLFEAGALSNALSRDRVCTYLMDLTPAELKGPLVQFQASSADRDDTFRLVQTLNKQLGAAARSESQLERIYKQWWPALEQRLRAIDQPVTAAATPKRSDRELLEEMLLLTRQKAQVDATTFQELTDYFVGIVDIADGPEIVALEKETIFSLDDQDPNASDWQDHDLQIPDDLLYSGVWASRWNSRFDPHEWQLGIATIAMHEKFFAIVHRDERIDGVVIGKRNGAKLRGREYNIRVRRDTGPYVGRIVAADRIDGAWSHGRWDLRRLSGTGAGA